MIMEKDSETIADERRRDEMLGAVAKTPKGFVNQEIFICWFNLLNSYESQRQKMSQSGFRNLAGQLEIFFIVLEPVYNRHEPKKCELISKDIYSNKRLNLDEIRNIIRELNLFLDHIGVTTLDNFKPGKLRGLEN